MINFQADLNGDVRAYVVDYLAAILGANGDAIKGIVEQGTGRRTKKNSGGITKPSPQHQNVILVAEMRDLVAAETALVLVCGPSRASFDAQ